MVSQIALICVLNHLIICRAILDKLLITECLKDIPYIADFNKIF